MTGIQLPIRDSQLCGDTRPPCLDTIPTDPLRVPDLALPTFVLSEPPLQRGCTPGKSDKPAQIDLDVGVERTICNIDGGKVSPLDLHVHRNFIRAAAGPGTSRGYGAEARHVPTMTSGCELEYKVEGGVRRHVLQHVRPLFVIHDIKVEYQRAFISLRVTMDGTIGMGILGSQVSPIQEILDGRRCRTKDQMCERRCDPIIER